ncbi:MULTISPECIES: ArsR/SmtB family transcription factor [Actinokineospora]|uniref:ArsR family transcriptional regulator n=1 Tax=Actinokineospora fastidiosa TaxID=1816 RepID=A0A918GPG4_9PSEU|nr:MULTISPECIES: transcriptional regulator [Actinokineospora]UVS77917.1 Helix-turn-helix domain protein [Actinokineospora sp. UTMC 2448]GGS51081.1 ArsR family transcriptional regulator [Actinokineospora fastidiosa]
MSEENPARTPATPVDVAVLGSAVRLRIIRMTHQRPLTNREIATQLDRDPATTLHHVRKLVDAGFLEALPVRRGNRGAREIPYRSTGRSWRIDNPGRGNREVAEAMLQAYLAEVGEADFAELLQSRLVVQVDEAGREELMRRIQDVLDDFAARPLEPGQPRTGIYVSFYPGE